MFKRKKESPPKDEAKAVVMQDLGMGCRIMDAGCKVFMDYPERMMCSCRWVIKCLVHTPTATRKNDQKVVLAAKSRISTKPQVGSWAWILFQ